MTETTTADPKNPPDADTNAATASAKPVHIPPATRRMGPLLLILAFGLGVLIIAGWWLWLHPPASAPAPASTATTSPTEITALASRVNRLAAQMARMAATPPAPTATAKPPDLAPILARLSALEHRPPPVAPPAATADVTLLTTRLDQLDDRIKLLQSMAQLAVASVALSDGLPVGVIAHAPPALTRFATTPPPTLTTLRRDFPAAAAAARQAAQDTHTSGDRWDVLWQRIRGLVTVRQGTHVLIGNPATGILATAQADLDRGDLASALTILATLPPAGATAMAPWIAQAKSLVAARTAMAAALAETQAALRSEAKTPAGAPP